MTNSMIAFLLLPSLMFAQELSPKTLVCKFTSGTKPPFSREVTLQKFGNILKAKLNFETGTYQIFVKAQQPTVAESDVVDSISISAIDEGPDTKGVQFTSGAPTFEGSTERELPITSAVLDVYDHVSPDMNRHFNVRCSLVQK